MTRTRGAAASTHRLVVRPHDEESTHKLGSVEHTHRADYSRMSCVASLERDPGSALVLNQLDMVSHDPLVRRGRSGAACTGPADIRRTAPGVFPSPHKRLGRSAGYCSHPSDTTREESHSGHGNDIRGCRQFEGRAQTQRRAVVVAVTGAVERAG